MQALATPLSETAAQLEQASAHWLAMLGPRDPTPDPNRKPFDVGEWQAAAQSIGVAAGELRGLATDLSTLEGSNALDAAIDRAFWRGLILLVAFFGLLVAYRLLTARLANRRSA